MCSATRRTTGRSRTHGRAMGCLFGELFIKRPRPAESALYCCDFMISSYGNAFGIIGSLWGKSTGHRWFTFTKRHLYGVMLFYVVLLYVISDAWHSDIVFFPEPPLAVSYPEKSLDGAVAEFMCHVRFGAPKEGVISAQQTPRIKAFVNNIIHDADDTINTKGVPGSTFWEIEEVKGIHIEAEQNSPLATTFWKIFPLMKTFN